MTFGDLCIGWCPHYFKGSTCIAIALIVFFAILFVLASLSFLVYLAALELCCDRRARARFLLHTRALATCNPGPVPPSTTATDRLLNHSHEYHV